MLLSIVLATLVPASASFLVIVLIKAQILSRMGQALSLVATGLLLTLALTHLLPEAIEHSSDIHDIGLTIWGTIMVLIALEMLFNSHHHADTCPVCRASKAAKSRAAAQKAAAPITKIARSLTITGSGAARLGPDQVASSVAATSATTVKASDGATVESTVAHTVEPTVEPMVELVATFEEYRQGGSSKHQPAPDAPQGPLDTRSTLHHMGHSHHFNLKSDDIDRATTRAKQGGSLLQGLTNGGAPILAGSLFHSLCDGIVIASSFMVDPNIGVAVTTAILAHELPQQLSNYVLMLNFGMSRGQGFIVNAVAALGSLTGGLVFYQILDRAAHILPFALGIAGGSFLYVALSDILPRVNKTDRKSLMLRRLAYLALGAALAMVLSHHGHAH